MRGSRNKKRNKHKEETAQNRSGERSNVIIIDSDEDSTYVNDQVQQLHISNDSNSRTPNPPRWGAGAGADVDFEGGHGFGLSGSRSSSWDKSEFPQLIPRTQAMQRELEQQLRNEKGENSRRQSPGSDGPGQRPPSLTGFLSFSDSPVTPTAPRSQGQGHASRTPQELLQMSYGASPLLMMPHMIQVPHQMQTGVRPVVPDLLQQMVHRNPMMLQGMPQNVQGQQPAITSQVAAPVASARPVESEFPKATVKSGPPPGTKIVRDREPVSIRRHHARGGRLSVSEVNASIQECIDILSKAGEHVSLERLEAMILEKYQVRNFNQLCLQHRNFNAMPTANEHSRLLSKVNNYVHSFVRARSMCTLYELGECMREFHSDKLEFEKLNLGPLQAMPVVYELFKFPMDEYVPEITSIDIIEQLNGFLDSSNKWKDKVELDDFLEYLVAVYQVQTPFSLGVRLRSVPLAIQMLKKSKRDAAQSRKSLLESLSHSLTEDIRKAVDRFKESLFQSNKDSYPELKLHYSSLGPLEAVKEIYSKFELLAVLMEGEGTAMLQHRMKKFHSSFTAFRKSIEADPLTRQLFHLAVCLSTIDVEESAMEFLQEQRQPRESLESETETGKPKKDKPSQSAVCDKIINYINRCLQEGNLLLSHLRRIEEKVVESFQFPSFDGLGHGAFLFFLHTNTKIKEVLEECGGAMIGSVSSMTDGVRCFHPTYSDLKELVCQARHAGATQPTHLASIVVEQYGVTEVKALGHGNITRLCRAADSPGKHQAPQYNSYYEAALCGKSCPSMQGKQSVGRLGNQSREKAMAVLTSCPLLEDMETWSHWNLVFRQEHGSLTEFVARHGGRQVIIICGGKQEAVSDFLALETDPGKLLKISSQSTANSFNKALEMDDPVLAAGELVSLIVNSKGVECSPLALLANSVKTKLLSLRAKQGSSPYSMSSDRVDPKVLFIVTMMLRLPLRICIAVANQVLLEPLSQVVGSAKSKVAVMQACQMPCQKERLETLGMMLGITEWTESLQYKMTFPTNVVKNVVVDELFGQFDEGGDNDEKDDMELEQDSDDEDDDDEEEEAIDRILSDENSDSKHLAPSLEEGEISDSSEDDAEKSDERVVVLSNENVRGKDSKDGQQGDVSTEKCPEVEKDKFDQRKVGETSEALEEESCESDDDEVEEKAEEDKETSPKVTEEENKPLTREEICHRVVDHIRREEFGVGIELTEEASKLMKTQQERQGRSLMRLSKDLYSKDTHFVLELIQNADDNPYSSDIVPALRFNIDDCGVTIQNNELGFEENNIQALCDVGKSTKSKHTLGYIGQKGIGFKSVFRVTDRPEVHSNGFHICFDVKSGPMGYIMPHWIDEANCDENWKTQILLPWTDSIKEEIQTHAARFNDIQPSLLLFLHRLRKITISNKVECCEMIMHRQDFPTGEIEISHSHGVDRWLVVREVLDATTVSIDAKSGVDVQSTEIALAFPLRDKSNMMSYGTRLGQLPVFAFLPLQSYGFRFIVQGDFNVPSSRESVDKDSSWNQWLRDRIPAVFIKAWDSFLKLPDFSAMEAFISYLQFIPLEGEVMGFFSPVTSLIRAQLMAKDCMPVVGTSEKKDEMLWKVPSKTVMTQRSLVREIISPQLLLHTLGLYYLHWDVLEAVEHGVLQALGVNTISTDHLLQIGQGVVANWDPKTSPDQVKELAKWMACIYCSLDSFKENTEIFNMLKKMRIIPLSDGNLVSMEDTTVFLLTDHRSEEMSDSRRSKKNKETRDPLQALRKDVNIIHSDLTSTSDLEVNSQVTKLLSRMDINQMTPHDLIHSHVLPTLNSDLWKEKSPSVLISYLVCAKQVLFDSAEDMSRLKDVARVVTNHGVKLPSQDSVHFPMQFGNEVNLEQTFPMLSWTMVDLAYLPPNASKAEQQSWHEFFSLLGVQDFLYVSSTEVHLDQAGLINSPWASYKDLWQNLPEQFVIEDFSCEEFHSLVTKSNVPFETVCRLYKLMDKHWEGTYKKFMITKLLSVSGEVLKPNVDTSFAMRVKNLPWVPAVWATLKTDGNITSLMREQGLLSPCQLYCRNPDVEKLLAHTAKYLAVTPDTKSSFTRFLQIKSSVQKEAVKEALISWGQRSEGKPNTPAVFSTSMTHISEVYKYLHTAFPAGEIQDLYHKHPVIFIAPWEGNEVIVAGQMMNREEMWWTDDCGLFTKYRESLEKYKHPLATFKFMLPLYHGREELFAIARIDRTHNMLHLAELLKHITAVCTLEDDGVLQDILSLFCAIGQALAKADEIQAGVRTQEAQIAVGLRDKVKSLLSDCAVFPTKAKKLIGLKDQPMLADSKEWEKMFEEKPGVHFLLLELPKASTRRQQTPLRRGGHQMPDQIDPELINIFTALFEDIKPLSACVIWEEITSGFKPCARGQKYLHDIVGVLQRFLFSSFPDVYAELKTNVAHQLKDLIFTEVNQLEVKYELKDRSEVFEIRSENCIIKGNHFYFQTKNIENQSEINKEVARYFSSGDEECSREIRSFLSQAVSILEGNSHESMEDLLARQRSEIFDLPKEEEIWEVPLPVVPTFSPKVQHPPGIAVYEAHGDEGYNRRPSQDGQEKEGDASGPSMSWPPRSIPDFENNPALARKGSKKPASKFTPPEAPDYIKASKQLPANFRFEHQPENEGKQEKKGEGAAKGTKEGTKASQQIPSIIRFVSETNDNEAENEPKDKGQGSKDGEVHGRSGPGKERSDRPNTQEEEEDDFGTLRGKRKMLSESSSGDDEEGRTPASKRQSLETNSDQVSMEVEGQGQRSGSTTGKEWTGERSDAGFSRSEMAHSGQGLVAVPRQAKPYDGNAERPHGAQDKENQKHQHNMLRFNIPVWSDQADNVAFTELTSDISQITPPHQLEDNAQMLEIGRWGENLVYDYLKRQKECNATIEDIIWANSDGEKGLPYDFEMVFKTDGADCEDVYSVFIEVKATRTDDRAVFEISSSQVAFAVEQKERYQIFRVYGAGKDTLRLVRIDNLADRMKTKSVQLLMVI